MRRDELPGFQDLEEADVAETRRAREQREARDLSQDQGKHSRSYTGGLVCCGEEEHTPGGTMGRLREYYRI